MRNQIALILGQWSAFLSWGFIHSCSPLHKNCRRVPWGPQRQFLLYCFCLPSAHEPFRRRSRATTRLCRFVPLTRLLHTSSARLYCRLTSLKDAEIVRPGPDLRLRTLLKTSGLCRPSGGKDRTSGHEGKGAAMKRAGPVRPALCSPRGGG